MRQAPEEDSRPEPGVIATITAGFELTTSHPWLIAFPILVDLFLWLGPRLSVEHLMVESQRIFITDPGFSSMFEQITELSVSYNLFTALSVPLIGVPALMSGASPEKTPLLPAVYDLNSASEFVGLFGVLTLIGLLLAAFYLSLVGEVLRTGTSGETLVFEKITGFLKSAVKVWIRLLVLGIFLVFTILAVMFPLLPLAYVLALVSQGLSFMVIMLGIVIVVTYLSMSIPSIVVDQRPVAMSIVYSFRFVRRYLLPTMNLLLLIVVISWGTDLLWHLADNGNWLTLVSIAGHGFVSTALVVSLFVFYRDRAAVIAD